MKVLICGSRDWTNGAAVKAYVDSLPDDAIVIEGEARGVDRMARIFAKKRGLFVAEVSCDSPHWERYGKSAGHKRNAAMLALSPDVVVAFHLGDSPGTQGTINAARALGIPVEVRRAVETRAAIGERGVEL